MSFYTRRSWGVLVVEFYGETQEEAIEHAIALAKHLQNQQKGYAWPVISNKQEIEAVFTVRKKGLGLLMGVKDIANPLHLLKMQPYRSNIFQITFEKCLKFVNLIKPRSCLCACKRWTSPRKTIIGSSGWRGYRAHEKISSQVLKLVKNTKVRGAENMEMDWREVLITKNFWQSIVPCISNCESSFRSDEFIESWKSSRCTSG